MPARLRVTNEQLIAAYAETGSVHKVGERFGMRGSSAHERLVKLGVVTPVNIFKPEEERLLEAEYDAFAAAGKLGELALRMGRTKHFLCRQARRLGLTDKDRARPYHRVWKGLSEGAAAAWMDAFKASSLNMGQFCKKHGLDDLGFSRTMQEHFADEWESVIESKASRQGWYRLGRQFEYRTRDNLKAHGFFVTRSPASKSPVDLVGLRIGCAVLVQCKRGGAIGVTEWNALFALASSIGAVALLAAPGMGGRGVEYQRLTGFKDGTRGKRQPLAPWSPVAAEGETPRVHVVVETVEPLAVVPHPPRAKKGAGAGL